MQIVYPDQADLLHSLTESPADSFDFIVIITGALTLVSPQEIKTCLDECVRILRDGGLLFVQGNPEYLPEFGVYLDRHLNFKYWIALESALRSKERGLPSVHTGLLLFTKGNGRFNIRRVRRPHQSCAFCGKPLKDWGGKSHLMHPEGYAISDVWADPLPRNNYSQLSHQALDTILQMLDFAPVKHRRISGLIGPREGVETVRAIAEAEIQYRLPGFGVPMIKPKPGTGDLDPEWLNVVHCGDALEILKKYPNNSIDLVFADPPYNLQKDYNLYDDEQNKMAYLEWCHAWLGEYGRILKPNGSLFVLNLPHWTMYHAAFLNAHLYFQNWIVWDALSEPRGKLMPAHYGLLWYTKHPTRFTFNLESVGRVDARYYCLRATCIRQRKAAGADDKESLTDIWRDIHRIKHKRDRDSHPCQLPDSLMERIILLSTNPGDIVLDAMAGAGTTVVAAVKLGRQYIAIDVDKKYVEIMRRKVAEVERQGFVRRKSVQKPPREFTKKELQLELRYLAAKLGRLPTPEDVRQMSRYTPEVYFQMFPTWGKALKAAKLEALHD